jgi:hypothetical protein
MMKLLIISALALGLSLEVAFALPALGKAQVKEPTLTAEDLAILQNRPTVRRYNVQTQGWALKIEEAQASSAKTTEGEKAL